MLSMLAFLMTEATAVKESDDGGGGGGAAVFGPDDFISGQESVEAYGPSRRLLLVRIGDSRLPSPSRSVILVPEDRASRLRPTVPPRPPLNAVRIADKRFSSRRTFPCPGGRRRRRDCAVVGGVFRRTPSSHPSRVLVEGSWAWVAVLLLLLDAVWCASPQHIKTPTKV
jgi:hypothetical protein